MLLNKCLSHVAKQMLQSCLFRLLNLTVFLGSGESRDQFGWKASASGSWAVVALAALSMYPDVPITMPCFGPWSVDISVDISCLFLRISTWSLAWCDFGACVRQLDQEQQAFIMFQSQEFPVNVFTTGFTLVWSSWACGCRRKCRWSWPRWTRDASTTLSMATYPIAFIQITTVHFMRIELCISCICCACLPSRFGHWSETCGATCGRYDPSEYIDTWPAGNDSKHDCL